MEKKKVYFLVCFHGIKYGYGQDTNGLESFCEHGILIRFYDQERQSKIVNEQARKIKSKNNALSCEWEVVFECSKDAVLYGTGNIMDATKNYHAPTV